VTRDVDVLSQLARSIGFTVHVSLISLDRDLVRKLEPGAPAPASRLRTIERLAAAGIPVSLFLSPVLPGITDRPEQLEELVRAAVQHGARDVWTGALRLSPGVKEHFMETIARHVPAMASTYRRTYAGGSYAPTGYQLRVEGQVSALRRAEGIERPAAETSSGRCSRRGPLAHPI
jgi:DNA repair photolyase